MKRSHSILLILFCIFITIWIPPLLFQIQDHMDIGIQNLEKKEELYKKYPVIAAIYADSYSDVINSTKYEISQQDTYDETVQKIIQNAVEKCETELSELIEKQVLTKTYLLNQYDPITYGTIDDPAQAQASSYTLTQILAIEGDDVTTQSFTYLKQVNKISKITIRNEYVEQLGNETCKEIASNMIAYLGLDKIEDWSYIDHGYESYQAKVKILCQVVDHQDGGYQELQILALPLALQYENVWMTRLEHD